MQLVKFLLFSVALSHIIGAFGLFPFGSSAGALYIGDVLLILSILFFAIWVINTKDKLVMPPLFKLITLFWLIGIVSLIWSLNFFPFLELFGGLYLIRFIIYSATLFIVYNLFQKGVIRVDNLINLFILVGLSLATLGLLQFIIFPDLGELVGFGFDPHKGRLSSPFLDPNFTGAYLNLTSGLVLYKYITTKERKVWLVTLIMLIVAIILTFSRSTYLMFAISSVVFGILKWKKVIPSLVVIFILSSLIVPQFLTRVKGGLTIDVTARERFTNWKNGLYIFSKSPILGVGFNNLRIAQKKLNLFRPYSKEGGHSGSGTDSGAIFVLATTGIVGLFLYTLFWLKLLKALIIQSSLLSFILFSLFLGLLINGQFINSLFFPPIMFWFYSMVGISVVERG